MIQAGLQSRTATDTLSIIVLLFIILSESKLSDAEPWLTHLASVTTLCQGGHSFALVMSFEFRMCQLRSFWSSMCVFVQR